VSVVDDDDSMAILLVAKCASSWPNETIRLLCEGLNKKDDFLGDIPVTVMGDRPVTYRNKYCAYCNQQDSFVSWNALMECDLPGVHVSDCFALYEAPSGVENRHCIPGVVSSCSPDYEGSSLAHECLFGDYSHVVLMNSETTYYRNPQCALCNGIRLEDIFCIDNNTDYYSHWAPGISFRCLVDINRGSVSCTNAVWQTNCKDTEIYDSGSHICRDILPLFGVECEHGVCRTIQKQNVSVSWLPVGFDGVENCTLSKLEPDEFLFTDNETLVEKATGIEYYKLREGEAPTYLNEFIKSGNNVLFVLIIVNSVSRTAG